MKCFMNKRLSSRIALALVVVAGLSTSATVRAETFTFQSTDTGLYAVFYGFDEATNTFTYGFAYVTAHKQHVPGAGQDESVNGYLYFSSYNYTTGESCYAFGWATDPSIAANLSSGSATTTATMYCYLYDPSTGTYTVTTQDVGLSVDLQALDGVFRTKRTDTFKDPSHFNSRNSVNGSSRWATGTFSVDGVPMSPYYIYAYLYDGRLSSKVTINP